MARVRYRTGTKNASRSRQHDESMEEEEVPGTPIETVKKSKKRNKRTVIVRKMRRKRKRMMTNTRRRRMKGMRMQRGKRSQMRR